MTHFDGLAYNQTLDYRFEDHNFKQEKTVVISYELLGADYFCKFPGVSRLINSNVAPDNFLGASGLITSYMYLGDSHLIIPYRVLFAPDNFYVCVRA